MQWLQVVAQTKWCKTNVCFQHSAGLNVMHLDETTKENKPTIQKLCSLRPPVFMAKKMGESLE
jgi:hypothetical protein